jgi:UPF0755 protein
MRRFILLLLIPIVVTAAAGAMWAQRWLQTPLASLQAPMVYEVPRGATLRSVGRDLKARKVLAHPEIWWAWARATGQASLLKAGEYELQPGLTPQGVLAQLNSGKVVMHAVTFVEGSTFAELRRQLETNDYIRAQFVGRPDSDIMQALKAPGVHPEGQFFPDTYQFPKGTTDIELLSLAYRRMQTELANAWQDRQPNLRLANSYQALILASIVEKETGLDSERPMIAGVFLERLRLGMRLQTDPSVIYGIQGYDGDIRTADLRRDTPYNTYTRAGLPPTPIALPGAAALRAVAQPNITGALYFVATGEADRGHYFSKTLPEHEAAVQRYLARTRSAP